MGPGNFRVKSVASSSRPVSTVSHLNPPFPNKIRACRLRVDFPDLSAPVDVYSDWIDACDAVAKDTTESGPLPEEGLRAVSHNDAEPDLGIVDDEDDDGEADFEL